MAHPRLVALFLILAPSPAIAQEPERVAVPAQADRAGRITAPKLWDEAALRDWALPVAGLGKRPGFLSSERYYARPVDNLRTYPVYHPDREPAGYREQLLRRGPQPLVEPAKLVTEADWLAAGQRVFEELDTQFMRTDDPLVIGHFTDAASVDKYRDDLHDVLTEGGVIRGYRWVVDYDRKLKISLNSCASCHTTRMPDGSWLPGGAVNYGLAQSPAFFRILEPLRQPPGMTPGESLYMAFGVPWLPDDVHRRFLEMAPDEIGAFFALEHGAPVNATFDRFSGSPYFTTRMADLRGVATRKFFDATATHQNRGPADLARYAILVEFADEGTFGPHSLIPEGAFEENEVRPLDEAMYALALYLYSLDVPKSPHPVGELARRGQQIFADEGCKKCHTPPLYTNNELVAVPGFEPPRDDPATAALPVMRRRVDTDPGLALQTRKGTGYYRVPSLRGVWYRALYEHSGSVKTLEDWFDPARLEADYVPTGWRGPGIMRRAVPGHEFGLDLEPDDKAALIGFLRTL